MCLDEENKGGEASTELSLELGTDGEFIGELFLQELGHVAHLDL